MNAPFSRLFPRHALWLTLAGLIFGSLAAGFIKLVQKPEYESVAVCRPLRPAIDDSGISHREWLNTEAAAMRADENLRRIARNLNLEREWHMGASECSDALKERLRIEVLPDTALIRISARGLKTVENAAIVNAVIVAREEFYDQKAGARLETPHHRSLALNWVDTLTKSTAKKRAALLADLKNANISLEKTDDEAIMELTLPKPLEKVRREWFAETVRLAETKDHLQALTAPVATVPYAEILEQGRPSGDPVEPAWRPDSLNWSLAGGGLGLAFAFVLERLRKLSSDSSFPKLSLSAPGGEY